MPPTHGDTELKKADPCLTQLSPRRRNFARAPPRKVPPDAPLIANGPHFPQKLEQQLAIQRPAPESKRSFAGKDLPRLDSFRALAHVSDPAPGAGAALNNALYPDIARRCYLHPRRQIPHLVHPHSGRGCCRAIKKYEEILARAVLPSGIMVRRFQGRLNIKSRRIDKATQLLPSVI